MNWFVEIGRDLSKVFTSGCSNISTDMFESVCDDSFVTFLQSVTCTPFARVCMRFL